MVGTSTAVVSARDDYRLLTDSYIAVLEKTNNQLSLWTNPYGLMVGTLTLLVAVGAVVVSIMLWWNSGEQKRRAREFFDKQEKAIQERNARAEKLDQERREGAKKEFDKLIAKQQQKLKSASSENKRKIQQAIDDLKKEKASVGLYPTSFMSEAPTHVQYGGFTSLFGLSNPKSMICAKCGKEFKYYDDQNSISIISLDHEKKVYCVYCGAVNMPQ